MNRVRATAGLVVVAALGLAACGGDSSSRPAATVGETEIPQSQVVDELEAIAANEAYLRAFQEPDTGAPPLQVEGTEEGTFDAAFVNEVLGLQILYTMVENEVAARDIEIDDNCRAQAREDVINQIDARTITPGDGEDLLAGFPDSYVERLTGWNAAVVALQADLSGLTCVQGDATADYYEEHRDEFEQACASHILVETREAADEVVALLGAGADFATIAAERSQDPGSAQAGGSVGCVTRNGGFVPEFEDAIFAQAVGEVGEPVETQFGFHVIRVDEREIPPLSEIEPQVEQAVGQQVQEAFRSWLVDTVSSTPVDVDPRYGRWDPLQGRIVQGE